MSPRFSTRWLCLAACLGLGNVHFCATRPRAAEPAKTHTVMAGEMKLAVPSSWVQKKPSNRFRLAQFAVPKTGGDTEDAELVVFFFGTKDGGNIEPNIHRWIDQFQPQGRKGKFTSGKCPQGDYVLVDLRGTWNKPIEPLIEQKTVEMRDARVLSLILTIKHQGSYFLRLMGPAKTVSANVDAFRAAIGADAKSEKDYKVSEEN